MTRLAQGLHGDRGVFLDLSPFNFGQIEYGQFRDHADDHGQAHQGRDVELDPCDPQAAQHRGDGQQDRGERRNRPRHALEQDGQQQRGQKERGAEHHGQVRKTLLLFGIEAAVIDAHGGRQVKRGDSGADGLHARAQVAALQARGHGHKGGQVFARQLLLARDDRHLGDLIDAQGVTIRRGQGQVGQHIGALPQIFGAADADGDQLFTQTHLGRRGPAYQAFKLGGNGFSVEFLLGGQARIDLDADGVAGDALAIDDFDDARNLADRIADLRCGTAEFRRVVAEKLDLDGLRHGGQVADQIFHELGGLDLEARHPGGHALPDIGHDVFDIAA